MFLFYSTLSHKANYPWAVSEDGEILMLMPEMAKDLYLSNNFL
jgi:hypothetical protein